MKTGSESHRRQYYARETDLVCGICGGMEDTRLSKCVVFGELVGGAGCVGGRKKLDGVSPGRPQNFRYQRRPVDDRSPGRGGMAQDGGTRGGMFHGEMDR